MRSPKASCAGSRAISPARGLRNSTAQPAAPPRRIRDTASRSRSAGRFSGVMAHKDLKRLLLSGGSPAQRPPQSIPASLITEGLAHHRAGRLAEAERIYNQILAARPDHFDSRHLLGVIFLQRGS